MKFSFTYNHYCNMTRFAAPLLISFIINTSLFAQLTTSGLAGRISGDGETLIGATVKATHEPSGTVYGTIANNEGRYNISGMRVGGPYHIEVVYLGFTSHTKKDIYLPLGETYMLNIQMNKSEYLLNEVVIRATNSKFADDRSGSLRNITSREMTVMPTINRTLNDYSRLSPYTSGNGSFGGRPAYATNITVDGANFNNNFGLNSNTMPGPSPSAADPISMEVIEEMQIATTPYDVRQSNFTGANVNVVTKSGTNTFHWSGYTFFRNQNFNGTKIKDKKLDINNSERQIYGVTLGGPVIKNKLFFFINGEIENRLSPGNTLLAMKEDRDSTASNVNQHVKSEELERFSHLLDSIGYQTERYENWGGDNESSRKLLAKLDWNIHQNHKASLRYNYSKAQDNSRPNDTNYPPLKNYGSRHAKGEGMSFENSQYRNTGTLHSIVAELNSRLENNLSNNLQVTFTNYSQPRETDSEVFPFIDILDGNGKNLMSAGYELFTYHTGNKQKTWAVTDNINWQLGNHNLTAGLSYESQYVTVAYVPYGTGYYQFKSLDAFKNYISGNASTQPYSSDYYPIGFAYTYPINGHKDLNTKFSFGQASAYMQDEWFLTDAFRITGGLRIDFPMYLWAGDVSNDSLKNYEFRNGETVDISKLPNAQPLFSPRIGFNYETEDKSIHVRGGVGVFTGRMPSIWFVNQPFNCGTQQYQFITTDTADLERIPFEPDVSELLLLENENLKDIFPQEGIVKGVIAATDKNFKLPQVVRTSLAVDFRLPLDMTLTLEGVFTKDINAICFDNINMAEADTILKEGNKERPYWTQENKHLTKDWNNEVIILRNTNKGYGYGLSAQLTLPAGKGFNATIAYAYAYAEEVIGKCNASAVPAWNGRHITSSLNNPNETGFTVDNIPHRIVASLNYQIDYAKNCKSTISLLYTGSSGTAYSYIYSNDANGDGASNDLIYIPKNKDDVRWDTEEDFANWYAYIINDTYLLKHRGEYAKRFAAHEPFHHRLDLRYLQDFYLNAGGQKHTLQLSLDILNLPNLLNSSWGIHQVYAGTGNKVSPLIFKGRDEETGKAIVAMDKNFTSALRDPNAVSATWNLQVGLRYTF